MASTETSRRPTDCSVLSSEEWEAATAKERVAAESKWIALITRDDSGGDLWAFEQLYRAYRRQLRAFARRWLPDAEAQEAVQSAFCNLWVGRRGLLIRTSVRAYLFRAIRNYGVDAHRKEARAAKAFGTYPSDESIWLVGAPSPTPTDHLNEGEIANLCKRAIAALPDRTRLVITLFYYHGMSRAEIAFVLDTSPDTIHNEISAASRALREIVHPADAKFPAAVATLER